MAAPPVANAGDDVVAAAPPIATGVDEVAAAIGGEVSTDGGEVSSDGGDVSSLGGEVSSDGGDISVGDEPEPTGYVSVGDADKLDWPVVDDEISVTRVEETVFVGTLIEDDEGLSDDVGPAGDEDVGPAGEDDVGPANDDEDDPPPVPVKALIPVVKES